MTRRILFAPISHLPKTMPQSPRIAIVYISYHSEPYLADAARALAELTYDRSRLELVVVDQPHPEHGSSAPAIAVAFEDGASERRPHVTVLPQDENRGFAGGANAGIQWAQENGFDYVYLHNDDGRMAPDGLEPLVAALEADPDIAAAQSLILLDPETHLVNTAGNVLHYCFLGYCGAYRRPVTEITGDSPSDVGFVSGAAVLLRLASLEACGRFDEDLFLYGEDLELSCRLRLAGLRVVSVHESKFFHRYHFSRTDSKLYWLERNRYAVMLKTLRVPTLVLLLPPVFALEVGLALLAWRRGWLAERRRVWAYWLRPAHWRLWWRKRRSVQRLRRVSDRAIVASAAARLDFPEDAARSRLLDWIGNPFLAAYFHLVVRPLLWW